MSAGPPISRCCTSPVTGSKDAAGELHLAARNTSPNRLVSTAIDATRVNQLIRTSRAGSVVLFLDCCYGGAFERGMVARAAGTVEVQGTFDQKSLGSGRGRVVITASSAVQYAFEGRDLTEGGLIEPSVFTGAIVDGIRDGLADRDGDGYVGLAELYDYVYERVRSRTPHQTPSKWEYGLQGELVISRSPRRVVRAAQLPPELVEIMRHPYSAARLGAITELTRLVDGDDLGLATAAVAALGVMSEDDSRGVSAEAAAVLASRRPTLSVDSFDFGQLTIGGPVVERNCLLSGPPLIEAAEVIAAVPQLPSSAGRADAVDPGRAVGARPAGQHGADPLGVRRPAAVRPGRGAAGAGPHTGAPASDTAGTCTPAQGSDSDRARSPAAVGTVPSAAAGRRAAHLAEPIVPLPAAAAQRAAADLAEPAVALPAAAAHGRSRPGRARRPHTRSGPAGRSRPGRARRPNARRSSSRRPDAGSPGG